jgi:hypothetical protein
MGWSLPGSSKVPPKAAAAPKATKSFDDLSEEELADLSNDEIDDLLSKGSSLQGGDGDPDDDDDGNNKVVTSGARAATAANPPAAAAPTNPPGGGSNWTQHVAPDGRAYFYNALTNKTTWVIPAELMPVTAVERAGGSGGGSAGSSGGSGRNGKKVKAQPKAKGGVAAGGKGKGKGAAVFGVVKKARRAVGSAVNKGVAATTVAVVRKGRQIAVTPKHIVALHVVVGLYKLSSVYP